MRIKEIINASDSPRTRTLTGESPAPPDIPHMDDLNLDDDYDDVIGDDSEMADYDEAVEEGMGEEVDV